MEAPRYTSFATCIATVKGKDLVKKLSY